MRNSFRWRHRAARMTCVVACLLASGMAGRLAADPAAPDSTWVDHYRAGIAAGAAGDFATLRDQMLRVRAILGEQPGVSYKLAAANARLGRRDEALGYLRTYAATGLGHDAAVDSDFVELWPDSAFQRIARSIHDHGRPIDASERVHRFADPDLLTEDLAYDAASRSYYASSIHRGVVVAVAATGQERTLQLNRADEHWGVFAVGLDAPRHLLWATLAALPTAEHFAAADSGRSAIVAYDLRRDRVVKRLECRHDGAAHLLGDMTVTPDGTVWVTDTETGALNRVRPGRDTLETFCAAGTFESAQTPVLAAGGKRLYVADYSRGIGIVDLATRARTWMSFVPGIGVQGIDGLYRDGRDLIGVQNGTRPERITRFRLDRDGTRVVGYQVLEQATPWLGEPNHGIVMGSDFVFLANSGWDRVGRDQALSATPGALPAEIRRRSLDQR